MDNAMWLVLAAFAAWAGMALLAMSLDTHWRQVSSMAPPGIPGKRILRALGGLGLVCALGFCLVADHATMAILVWVMFLTGAAFAVGMLLVWLPATLRPFSFWIR